MWAGRSTDVVTYILTHATTTGSLSPHPAARQPIQYAGDTIVRLPSEGNTLVTGQRLAPFIPDGSDIAQLDIVSDRLFEMFGRLFTYLLVAFALSTFALVALLLCCCGAAKGSGGGSVGSGSPSRTPASAAGRSSASPEAPGHGNGSGNGGGNGHSYKSKTQ